VQDPSVEPHAAATSDTSVTPVPRLQRGCPGQARKRKRDRQIRYNRGVGIGRTAQWISR
jgi:hypothetical protein